MAKRVGEFHLILKLCSSTVLSFYILSLFRGGDDNEISTLLIGFGVTLFHFVKTLFGLRLMYCCKFWVAPAIQYIHSFVEVIINEFMGHRRKILSFGDLVYRIEINDFVLEKILLNSGGIAE